MGCVSSKHRLFRRKSTLKDSSDKRSSSIDSSGVDDWIQPGGGLDRSSSRGETKDKLVDSETFSSTRFNDHQIVNKILEHPEKIADHVVQAVHDQDLTRVSSDVDKHDLEIGPSVIKRKQDQWNSIDSKVRLIEKEPEFLGVQASVQAVPWEMSKTQCVVVPNDIELRQLSSEWPTWLVSVAGEALVDWAPRRASTFEKLEKVSFFSYKTLSLIQTHV